MAGDDVVLRGHVPDLGRRALADLIDRRARNRTDIELARDGGVDEDGRQIISDATMNYLHGGRELKELPKVRTMVALADRVLHVTQREVLLDAGAACGMDVSDPDSELKRRLHPRAHALDRHPLLVAALLDTVEQMVHLAESLDHPNT